LSALLIGTVIAQDFTHGPEAGTAASVGLFLAQQLVYNA